MWLILIGCQDYNLEGKDQQNGMDDSGQVTGDSAGGGSGAVACDPTSVAPEEVGVEDTCDYDVGGFEPIVEWDVTGVYSTALPVVGDLDLDGMPEIVFNFTTSLVFGKGMLTVYRGDGSGMLWQDTTADLGFGAHPAIGDLDGDGSPEVLGIREYSSGVFGNPDYTLLAWSAAGTLLWETAHYTDGEFDYATGPAISDMDHDGSPEIIAGRVIFNADGTERGVGDYGCGSPAPTLFLSEGCQPAVADIDLDGEEEVITGNAMYDADGNTVWHDLSANDGAVAIANLDDDPEGEFVATARNELVARDTDGTLLWGPLSHSSVNIFSIPTVGDIDNDGYPEIIVAGGNLLWALNHDGTLLWDASVTDMSGATGASIFDFDADGVPEVVYIDEVEMIAFNGSDGMIKFHSTDHASNTMYDYPVIADVDADNQAEIIVVHNGLSSGASIYGDLTESWAPARSVWNQHAYSITHVNDDLSIPTNATPNFTLYNNFHSALALAPGEGLGDELQAEIVDVCEEECADGVVYVLVRGLNRGNRDLPAGIYLSLYARSGSTDTLLATVQTTTDTLSGMSTEALQVEVEASALSGSDALYLRVDDDGTGVGVLPECMEENNDYLWDGPFCDG